MTSTKLMKRSLVALAALLTVSTAFALGAYADVPALWQVPTDTARAVASWTTAQLSGGSNDAWAALAALAVMAVIAKRTGKG